MKLPDFAENQNFVVGEYAVCVDPGPNRFITLGKIYQVLRITTKSDRLALRIRSDDASTFTYYATRFVPFVEEDV